MSTYLMNFLRDIFGHSGLYVRNLYYDPTFDAQGNRINTVQEPITRQKEEAFKWG